MHVLPIPDIRQRPIDQARYQEAIDLNVEPMVARLLASRGLPQSIALPSWLEPSLLQLDSPESLIDIEKASNRIIQAIVNKEIIALETDHDCDGQTSHAVLYHALHDIFKVPKDRIQSYIGHRLEEGYGLSVSLMKRILVANPRPSLVITADNGSSDEAQIKVLKEAGIDVIVSDHHSLPQEGPPQSAFACINPAREDSAYPDPYIAGCMVAWLLMAWTRSRLIALGVINKQSASMSQLLDYVAVGTVADCVSMSRSLNNRIVVRAGLKLLNQFKRPCWRAIREAITQSISSEDLGFKIAPLLNSDGRLACAFGSINFLLSEDDQEALNWVSQLNDTNIERKAIQKQLTFDATARALVLNTPTKKSLTVFLPLGHPGVHGITASKIKDAFGKPTFIFSPKANDAGVLTGSGRSIDACHLRDALQVIADMHPGLLLKFGGHRGAAGVAILESSLEVFSSAFEEAVTLQVHLPLRPLLFSDGPLPPEAFEVHTIESMDLILEPFGREFDPPLFELEGELHSMAWMGADKVHMRFMLKQQQRIISCVWFFARASAADACQVAEGDWVKVLASMQVDSFRSQKRLKALIRHLEPVRAYA